jgi:hypothetical protein
MESKRLVVMRKVKRLAFTVMARLVLAIHVFEPQPFLRRGYP